MRIKFLKDTMFAPNGNNTSLHKADSVVDVKDADTVRNLTSGKDPLAVEVKVQPNPETGGGQSTSTKKQRQAVDGKGKPMFDKDGKPIMVDAE